MKKISKIGVLICMISVLTLALTGCEFEKKENNREEINKKDLEGYTEYVHSSGIKFSYPSEWQDLGSTDEQPIFGNASTGMSVNYISETVSKTYDIDTYMEAAIKNVKSQMQVVGDLKEEKVKLNGNDASIIEYTVNQTSDSEDDYSEEDNEDNNDIENGINVVIKQACFMEDGTAHILTVACLEKQYDEQAEVMNNIINTFGK